jgi:DNA-binding NarL/FixJ family response regulator
MPTLVLLLGEDALTRGGAAALLAGQPLVELAGQGTLDEAPALLAGAPADVICWDPSGGEEEAERLVAGGAARGVPVLALLGGRASGGALWRAGVRALVDRGTTAAALAAALHAAAQGLAVLEPEPAEAFLHPAPPAPGDGGRGGPDALTPREREVLSLLTEGLGNKAIAGALGVSDHTAKFHVNAILAKLGAGSRAEAIVLAARAGLVAL